MQSLARLARQRVDGRDEQVAERAHVASPDAAPQLMQVGQAVALGVVHNHRVGVRHVQAGLDDGGRDQHVEPVVREVDHDLLERARRHLAVRRPNTNVRHERLDGGRHLVDGLDAVVQEEHLAAAVDLVQDGVADQVARVGVDLGHHRLAVQRRRLDERQVARAQQRELQRARDRRRRERQRVHVRAQLAQLLLGRDAEALFLVYDQQPEVLELDIFGQDTVRADHDVDLADGELADDLLLVLRGDESRQGADLHGEALHALAERLDVLPRQNRRRHHDGDLLSILDSLERRPDGDLRFAEADVAADQTVHGDGLLHVLLDRVDGDGLVGRFGVAEARFELALPDGVGVEGEALAGAPLGVDLDEVARDVLDALLGAALEAVPGAGAQLGQAWLVALLAGVLVQLVQRRDVDEQLVAAGEEQAHRLLPLLADGDGLESGERADAVVHVDHEVAGREGLHVAQREAAFSLFASARRRPVVAVEKLVVGVNGERLAGV